LPKIRLMWQKSFSPKGILERQKA